MRWVLLLLTLVLLSSTASAQMLGKFMFNRAVNGLTTLGGQPLTTLSGTQLTKGP